MRGPGIFKVIDTANGREEGARGQGGLLMIYVCHNDWSLASHPRNSNDGTGFPRSGCVSQG